jgi:predicted ATP-dependent endonuclease of OLD family
MHISSLKVSNYKSFRSSDAIRLSKGFNIIVGKNNSGKTALAEASTLSISDKPHRSRETVPYRGASHSEKSSVDVKLRLSGDEIRRLLVDRGGSIEIPANQNRDDNPAVALKNFFQGLEENNSIKAKVYSGRVDDSESWQGAARITVDEKNRSLEPSGGWYARSY